MIEKSMLLSRIFASIDMQYELTRSVTVIRTHKHTHRSIQHPTSPLQTLKSSSFDPQYTIDTINAFTSSIHSGQNLPSHNPIFFILFFVTHCLLFPFFLQVQVSKKDCVCTGGWTGRYAGKAHRSYHTWLPFPLLFFFLA